MHRTCYLAAISVTGAIDLHHRRRFLCSSSPTQSGGGGARLLTRGQLAARASAKCAAILNQIIIKCSEVFRTLDFKKPLSTTVYHTLSLINHH